MRHFFNTFFSFLPIIWYGINDKEISFDLLIKYPYYYTQGIKNRLFHSRRFWKWVIYGMLEGFFVFLFCFYINQFHINKENGFNQEFWSIGK